MRRHRLGAKPWSVAGPLLLVLAVAGLRTAPAAAGTKIAETEDLLLELGIRLQPRMELENQRTDWQRDFLIRRSRLKLTGKAGKDRKASFNFEWRLDSTDRIGNSVSIGVENGYVQYPLGGGADLRVGLYDQPYSRDRLTSDSKQLVVDRGLVSGVPDALGLADNAVGVEVVGKVNGGRLEYAAGAFDNRNIPGGFQDLPMLVGRLDLNFGATKNVFYDAHFGDESWYSLGVNGSWQDEIEDMSGATDGSNAAVGIDGMIDIPVGPGRLLVRSEGNVVKVEDAPNGGNSLDTQVWMAGLGYLLWNQRFQPTLRFDQVRRDDAVGGGTQNVTYVGANFYQNGHTMKVQGDVRFEGGTGESVDGVRLQAQFDF